MLTNNVFFHYRTNQWLAFFDSDEFFAFKGEDECIPEFVKKMQDDLQEHPPGAIAFRWRKMVRGTQGERREKRDFH